MQCLQRCRPSEWAGTDPDAPSLDSSGRSYSTSGSPASAVWRPTSCPLSPTQPPQAGKTKQFYRPFIHKKTMYCGVPKCAGVNYW